MFFDDGDQYAGEAFEMDDLEQFELRQLDLDDEGAEWDVDEGEYPEDDGYEGREDAFLDSYWEGLNECPGYDY